MSRPTYFFGFTESKTRNGNPMPSKDWSLIKDSKMAIPEYRFSLHLIALFICSVGRNGHKNANRVFASAKRYSRAVTSLSNLDLVRDFNHFLRCQVKAIDDFDGVSVQEGEKR